MNERYDLVVVGSGIAGLCAALLAAPHGRVLLLTKGALEESNTRYAQGGIAAAVGAGDAPELHLRDTIAAGDGLCDPAAAAVLTRAAPDCIADLLRFGVPFDRDGDDLALTLEAAHSRPRVLHAGGDATGAAIERSLADALEAAGVSVLTHAFCTALGIEGGRVVGVEVLTGAGPRTIDAGNVILASGGAGRMYARTTNPVVATGDGIALAYRAGAQVADLEFVQFHPTALAIPGGPSFLISEAVRGEGGILRDRHGSAFMGEYHPDRELAPRDVVARAIHRQEERTGGPIVLDLTHLDPQRVEHRFPSILRTCRDWGIDPIREPVPVSPAAHYLMGGVWTDVWGRTSVLGLYACGEVACTGVHGANRLASNSLLEGLVFAARAVQELLNGDHSMSLPEPEYLEPAVVSPAAAPIDQPFLAETMWRDAGLVRSASSLDSVARMLSRAVPREPMTPAEHEAANLSLVARLVVAAAMRRNESRGAHFREDFPTANPAWAGHLVHARTGTRFVPMQVPVGAGRT